MYIPIKKSKTNYFFGPGDGLLNSPDGGAAPEYGTCRTSLFVLPEWLRELDFEVPDFEDPELDDDRVDFIVGVSSIIDIKNSIFCKIQK